MYACLSSGSCGEADPVSQRCLPDADRQPERRAGHKGETHHRAAGVRHHFDQTLLSLYEVSGAVLILLLIFVQSESGDHAGAGEAESGAREGQDCRPGEEPSAARAHVMPLPLVNGKI